MTDAYDFWADRLSVEETAAVAHFWERFETIAPALDKAFSTGNAEIDPAEATIDAIGALNDFGIFWEYGPGESGHHLALSPELKHSARPLARALINSAPSLERWTFSDARPPISIDGGALNIIEGRARRQNPLLGIQPHTGEHYRVDFVGTGRGDEDMLADFAALTFSILFGEAVERDWLGQASGEANGGLRNLLSKRPKPTDWLPEFCRKTQDILNSLKETRPSSPRSETDVETADHSIISLTPNKKNPALFNDLITYVTPHVDLAEAMFSGARISAPRFTRFPESFCGVTIERTDAHPFDDVEDRGDLSGALHNAMKTSGAGGLIGEGHGLRHVYIDFAITDIPLAIATIERELGRAEITGPAWFVFHEAGLEDRRLPLSPAARVQ